MAELGGPTPGLKHRVIDSGDGDVVLVLEGELDISTTDQLDSAARAAIDSVTGRLVVDVERLEFADSSAIALWVKWSKRVPRLEIRNPSPMVRRVIDSMGLREVLNPS